ncbi:unnamed protein product, partial [Gongylonema pulchrum]|uniref:Ion_trans domain-containing protein n=1 Tax=Gongylonema pulchrum TaxID=637853 RepID=A0A183F1J4_9BILA
MFVIFGLIMVGLALVSMCINVVQLKLEQLFEELLVMVLEEYKQKGVPQEEMIVPLVLLPIDMDALVYQIQYNVLWAKTSRKGTQNTAASKYSIFYQLRTHLSYFTKSRSDVTPTNSEDMFVIFGLIMVGLALVSMCINVVQLKLEQLFEELLVMVLEEYKQKGVPQEEMI